MKIDRIEAFQVAVPFKQAYTTSYSTINEFGHVFVKISTNEEVVGFGEVSSLPEFTGENLGTITEAVRQLGSVIKGCDPFDLEKIMSLMDKEVKFNNTAKAAIDFALHDIIGKSLGVNAVHFIGGRYVEKIPLSWSLTSGEPDKVAAEAVEMVEAGFDTVNLKIGANPDEDVERVCRVREAIGDKVNIRADANAAFTPMQAIQLIRRMEKYDMQYVEQPVPGWDLDGMAEVRRQVNVQISADEAVFYLHNALDVIKKGAADIFALKVAKMGGIRRTKQIATVAEAANMPCMVNSNFEVDIGVSAAAIVAASTRMVQYNSEITGPLRHQTDVIKKGVEYRDGFLIPPTGPGLGIEIDEKKLERYRIF
jgi:muconate cycloisomerase